MTALALIEVAADPFVAMRALSRMRVAGFALRLAGASLKIAPADRLTEEQRRFIRAHKTALVALIQDAEIVYRALVQAGPAGLAWMEGTPGDWTGERLLAAGEVLYGDGRMMSVYGRRYLKEHAPPFEWIEDAEAGEHAPAQINRRGQRRGATAVEISIQSPQALRTLAHSLRVADEEP